MLGNNHRVRELDEELLIAKEVSVRLHNELEKSEESRINTEKLNLALKQQLDIIKESLDEKLNDVRSSIDSLTDSIVSSRKLMMIIINGNYSLLSMNHSFVNICSQKN